MKYMYVMYGRKQISLNNVPINIIPHLPSPGIVEDLTFQKSNSLPTGEQLWSNFHAVWLEYTVGNCLILIAYKFKNVS